MSGKRAIHAPRGSERSCKGWHQEAAMRRLMNNLDPDVAENPNLVGQWNNYAEFNRLERIGLTMYGQMTAGSWIYIGSQGIVQGTFETFAAAGRKHFGGSLDRKFVLTGGLGGMGGAQPLAA